ncbi:hypothetical protein JG687_00010632 [Phytophthora cactorum]|nr:hypothetical protein JG687_00010632 [Phytophthora cactorum]RAW26174.1 hypothetical protein PC110_g17428 [Phytophthora cactorum]
MSALHDLRSLAHLAVTSASGAIIYATQAGSMFVYPGTPSGADVFWKNSLELPIRARSTNDADIGQ